MTLNSFGNEHEELKYIEPAVLQNTAPDVWQSLIESSKYQDNCPYRRPARTSQFPDIEHMLLGKPKTDYCAYHDDICRLRYEKSISCKNCSRNADESNFCLICRYISATSIFDRKNQNITFSCGTVFPKENSNKTCILAPIGTNRDDLICTFLGKVVCDKRLHIHVRPRYCEYMFMFFVEKHFHVEYDYRPIFNQFQDIAKLASETANPGCQALD